MSEVNLQLVEIALEHVTGTDFEKFFQAFYPALAGIDFIPLGGVHDGGADAFQSEKLLEGRDGRPNTFYQASIQKDHRAKIRNTVNRLKEYGRQPTSLQYFTSQTVSSIDLEEEHLSRELEIEIRIKDRKWIVNNTNYSTQTIAAFNSYLKKNLAFLTEIGAANTVSVSQNISARTMCVFLGQEIDRRRGKTNLLEAVTDSLILWALEDTDPDKKVFMTRGEILSKVEKALPSAKQFIRGSIDHRIQKLASKNNSTGREIRWYKKENKYCLPYETREVIKQENAEDVYLKLQVIDLYTRRASDILEEGQDIQPDQIAKIAHRALELTFEKEGLELAEFLSNDRDQKYYGAISDQVDEAIEETGITGESTVLAKEVSLSVLRQAFYSSSKIERIYYGKLSRTYTLLFTLRNEPKIVEYFKGMSSNFVLFVGADIIIRALSERYLANEDQMTRNMLHILKDAGSKLILTQVTTEEVHAHLEGTNYEFRNHFMKLESEVSREIARHSSKILIRTYFYAKLDSNLQERPRGWKAFIEQICSYKDLHKSEISREQIKDYLIQEFDFEFFDKSDMIQLVDESEVETLKNEIIPVKSDEILAYNDALQILTIYGKRKELGERRKPNPYGYRTWWLTHETKVLHVTGDIVLSRGSKYIIRPEFILNFVALSPTTEQVQKSYNTIFPTLLGVRLSNRMREDIFHDVMNKAKELKGINDARAKAMMIDMSNRLKGDNFKRYETNFNLDYLDMY